MRQTLMSKTAAGAIVAVAVATARLPVDMAAQHTIRVGGSQYWYADGGAYYTRVMSGGSVVYQVVGPPAGAIIATLPAGCTTARVGGVVYQSCGGTYYQRVTTGYQVVVVR
jgi:hypothetical protein